MKRRDLLLGLGQAFLLGACGGATRLPVEAPAAPTLPRKLLASGQSLTALLCRAGLQSLLRVRVPELRALAWLGPALDEVVPAEGRMRLEKRLGLALGQIEEAVLARYDGIDAGGSDATTLTLLRLREPAGMDPERAFRARLTGEVLRSLDDDLVYLRGIAGSTPLAFASLGDDVLVEQEGGDTDRGPARAAALFATAKLKRATRALDLEPLTALALEHEAAPVLALVLGPFEGELARGLRGLLGTATGLGCGLSPATGSDLQLRLTLSGSFEGQEDSARTAVLETLRDLEHEPIGRLLGLHQLATSPELSVSSEAVRLSLGLRGEALAHGLAAATRSSIRDIMR